MKQILLTLVPYAVLLKMIYDMPNEYPFDEDKIDMEGVDPDILELTPKELNFRANFDCPNESVLKRRSIVGDKMEALGLSVKDTTKDVSMRNLPESSRLSFVIRKEANIDAGTNEGEAIVP